MIPLAVELLNWLARLPFLAVDDLALLTGSPAPDVEADVRDLARAGQVDSITPSSPELETTRLYVLTEPIRRQVASAAWASGQETALPLEPRDILRRLASLEATVALNVFAADLAAALRRDPNAELEDLWALPTRRSATAWWPPGVHASGSIRIGAGRAPFFVVIDRAGAPSPHRTALVAAWYRFREGPQPRATGCFPPALILCPGPAWEDAWARHVLASADRRGLPPLPVLLASRAGLRSDPDGPHWRRADDGGRATLTHRLAATPAPSAYCRPRPPRLGSCPRDASVKAIPLHSWAQETARDNRKASRLELMAALSLTTSEVEKRLLDCLARHPLLTELQLATVLDVQRRVVSYAISRAVRDGLVAAYDGASTPTPHYCLTGTGLELFATRDGVPLRRYARHTVLTVLPTTLSGPLPTLLQQFEHTAGANSFFVSWLRQAPAGGPRLVTWLNAAEAAVRFDSAGSRRWLRPDGSGTVIAGERRFPFLLEWDRGTERLPVIASKLARYSEYFEVQRTHGNGSPTLLFVTTTPQREELVWGVATLVLGQAAAGLRTSTASLLEQLGPMGAIWRTRTQLSRAPWPERAAQNDNALEV